MTASPPFDVVVREAREDDDLNAVNQGNPQWFGEEQQRRTAASAPAGSVLMLIGERSGLPVGWGLGIAAALAAGGYGIAQVWVPAPHRTHGVGGALFARLEEFVRAAGLPGVMTTVPDSEPDGARAAAHRGLLDRGHHIESVLDLANVDDAVVARVVARVDDAGVQLAPLPDDADETCWQSAFAFFSARLPEAPDASDGGGELPYGVFRSMLGEPWQVLRAMRGGHCVGITGLTLREDGPHRLNTLFTGVHPDARGLGIAVALKAEHAHRVRGAGWREVWTQNMDQNAQILSANATLGFRAVAGYRDFGTAPVG